MKKLLFIVLAIAACKRPPVRTIVMPPQGGGDSLSYECDAFKPKALERRDLRTLSKALEIVTRTVNDDDATRKATLMIASRSQDLVLMEKVAVQAACDDAVRRGVMEWRITD